MANGVDVSFICDECKSDTPLYEDKCIVKCTNCGEYDITRTFIRRIMGATSDDTKRIYSVMLRRYWENNRERYFLHTRNHEQLLEKYNSFSLKDKINNVLNYFGKNSEPGKSLVLSDDSLFISPSRDFKEFLYIIEYLIDNKMLKEVYGDRKIQASYILTVEGWEKFSDIDSKINSKICFIAMSFRENEKEAEEDYKKVIKPLLEDIGFIPILIKNVEYNEDVVFKILYEIERCRFVIADVRGERPSVYYEAGYARALGREVIWLCKKGEENKMHFDTRNLNHIIWKDREELKEKLRSRIQGTILI